MYLNGQVRYVRVLALLNIRSWLHRQFERIDVVISILCRFGAIDTAGPLFNIGRHARTRPIRTNKRRLCSQPHTALLTSPTNFVWPFTYMFCICVTLHAWPAWSGMILPAICLMKSRLSSAECRFSCTTTVSSFAGCCHAGSPGLSGLVQLSVPPTEGRWRAGQLAAPGPAPFILRHRRCLTDILCHRRCLTDTDRRRNFRCQTAGVTL